MTPHLAVLGRKETRMTNIIIPGADDRLNKGYS